jgi:ketosteroid isomerase-like protein
MDWDQQIGVFVDRYPNAYWTPFAHYARGAIYEAEGTDVSGKRDAKMLTKALESYERSSEYETFAYADRAKEHTAMLKRLLGLAQKETVPSPSDGIGEAINNSMTNETRRDVEQAVSRFKAAHTAGRLNECEQMMTEDFLRGGSMDRAKSLVKMQKEFDKLQGKRLEAIPTFESVTTDGTNVIVAVDVVYRYDGQERSQKESYTLRQEQGQWKISRFAVTSSERPPGFQPYAPAQQK